MKVSGGSKADPKAELLASLQSNTNKQIKEMKDILLKTNERKKEILLSAGASAGVGGPLMVYSGQDQLREVTGFDEGDESAAVRDN